MQVEVAREVVFEGGAREKVVVNARARDAGLGEKLVVDAGDGGGDTGGADGEAGGADLGGRAGVGFVGFGGGFFPAETGAGGDVFDFGGAHEEAGVDAFVVATAAGDVGLVVVVVVGAPALAEGGGVIFVEVADGAEVGHEDAGAGEGGGAAVVHGEGVFPR